MPARCLLYYITDRTAFADDEPTRRRRLLEKIAEAARAGVDYIQLREKDLSTRDLELLAHEAVTLLNQLRTGHKSLPTALLINHRTDVALATGSDGIHLRANTRRKGCYIQPLGARNSILDRFGQKLSCCIRQVFIER